MPRTNPDDINQYLAPIELAMKMALEQQQPVFNTILGPEKRTRQARIEGLPADPIIETVIQQMDLEQ